MTPVIISVRAAGASAMTALACAKPTIDSFPFPIRLTPNLAQSG
jgi:hypothetical protein